MEALGEVLLHRQGIGQEIGVRKLLEKKRETNISTENMQNLFEGSYLCFQCGGNDLIRQHCEGKKKKNTKKN